MYYIAAEAQLAKGNDSLATWYFDQVLASRGLTPLVDRTLNDTIDGVAVSPMVTFDRINLERFKEFFGEGQTFYNLKRKYHAIQAVDESTGVEKKIAGDKKIYVAPIPDSEYENRF